MNTDTHEFWQEVYPMDDHRELKPPTSVTRNNATTGFFNHTELLVGPWTFVSVTAIPGYANGLFHNGQAAHVVVVWAREKK